MARPSAQAPRRSGYHTCGPETIPRGFGTCPRGFGPVVAVPECFSLADTWRHRTCQYVRRRSGDRGPQLSGPGLMSSCPET